jgi:hypothetical protein
VTLKKNGGVMSKWKKNSVVIPGDGDPCPRCVVWGDTWDEFDAAAQDDVSDQPLPWWKRVAWALRRSVLSFRSLKALAVLTLSSVSSFKIAAQTHAGP